jgi:hypothetical protein
MGDGFTKNHPLALLHPSQRKRVKLSWVKIAMKVTARLQETLSQIPVPLNRLFLRRLKVRLWMKLINTYAGHAMDAARIHWTILSAFRDDYRQGLASGLKAHINNSLHGGSAATGGYGHGCAVDIKDADGNSDTVWHWLDKNSAKIGLQRLLPRADPAHVQPRGAWHRLAVGLRNYRLGNDAGTGEPTTNTSAGSTAAPSDTEFACVSLRHWEGDSPQAKAPTGLDKAKAAAQFAKTSR